jgi:hypothetical protein
MLKKENYGNSKIKAVFPWDVSFLIKVKLPNSR